MSTPPPDMSTCSEHGMHDAPARGLRFSWWPFLSFLGLLASTGAYALFRFFSH